MISQQLFLSSKSCICHCDYLTSIHQQKESHRSTGAEIMPLFCPQGRHSNICGFMHDEGKNEWTIKISYNSLLECSFLTHHNKLYVFSYLFKLMVFFSPHCSFTEDPNTCFMENIWANPILCHLSTTKPEIHNTFTPTFSSEQMEQIGKDTAKW